MKRFDFSPSQDSLLTVITAAYNSAEYIEACLASLHLACNRLTDTKIAHIVIDGYSTDNTVKIVEKISPSSTIVKRERAGIYDALNYAVSLVKSPYLMYLHSDDELDKNFLVEMVKRLRKFSDYPKVILYGTVDFINEDSKILFSRRPPLYIEAVQTHFNLIFHPNAIYATLIEREYPYKTHIGLDSDYNHITEVAKTAKLIRVARAKYRFRMSASSSTLGKDRRSSWKPNIILPRIYLHLFETNLMSRLYQKLLKGKSYWALR